MTADILRPTPAILDDFNFDSLSLIEPEQRQGISTGAMTGELVNKTATRRNTVKRKQSVRPATKEFQVSRRNSLKKKSYYRLSQQAKPRKKRYSVHGNGGYEGRFDNLREIDQVFSINPSQKNPPLTEYPSYMIEYFVKNINLMKKDPIIEYQILKAKINQQRIGDIIEKERIKRPMSMPMPDENVQVSEKSKLLQKQNRESTPANMKFNYEPVEMSMNEYLNTPLDLYKHRKGHKPHNSGSTAKTKNTTSSSGRVTYGSSKSGLSSVDTNALLLQTKNSNANHIIVPTNKKGGVEVKRRSVQFDSSVIPESKLEESYEKYGLSPKESKAKFKIKEGQGNINSKRLSNKGIISIASGGEVYNNFKMDIFSHSFSSWNEAENYIFNNYPEYYENEYLMTNLILEIYTRRIITGRIALKLGTDKSKRLSTSDTSSNDSNDNSNVNDVWLGLKDVITSIYGEEQGNIFREQRYK